MNKKYGFKCWFSGCDIVYSELKTITYRSYSGKLKEENRHGVMECIRCGRKHRAVNFFCTVDGVQDICTEWQRIK